MTLNLSQYINKTIPVSIPTLFHGAKFQPPVKIAETGRPLRRILDKIRSQSS